MGSVALFPAKIEAYEGYIDPLEYPEIRMLAVNPQMRGKGIARALMMECIYRTKATGYHSIGLHTAEFMKDAIRLYEGLGFEHIPQFDFVPLEDGIVVKAYRLRV
ncbi:GNAT family N-acetyltransferase [Neobacillus sp. D3-1R]|uniref:GNAT family N-acetyltransferase n=1 Tax=Neobacillus sp. D3-1R TaxID=3445778 RepID=UPI003FA14FE7